MSQGLGDIKDQLRSGFYEEAAEALDQLEGGLLALEQGNGDSRSIIDDVFRAAHSIKGGAATFGLQQVAQLAHAAETLLDKVRAGALAASTDVVAALLASVDALRTLLQSERDAVAADLTASAQLMARLSSLASNGHATVAQDTTQPAAKAATTNACFRIGLRPHAHMLERGNDAVLLLRELDRMGELEVTTDLSALPSLAELDPTRCYLSFSLILQGEVTRAAIDDVFAWVEGDADLAIAELSPATEAAPAALKAKPTERSAEAPAERDSTAGSIRVAVQKLDLLMNMVGELVITQSMLGELEGDGPLDPQRIARLREGLSQLARNTRSLQESVMSLRSMPIGMVFGRLPRLVHDISHKLGKQVALQLNGQSTEIDKTVLEKLSDPLVHLIRNSLDHGLETPAERRSAGKPETGRIEVRAFHRGSDIIVEVEDDGRGLDLDKIRARAVERGILRADATIGDDEARELIFAPGFSTADTVSDVSGRGVGMDVVRSNVKSLGGDLRLASTRGLGTRVSLRLPLTLAIVDGQLVRLGHAAYVVPLLSILESVQVVPARVSRLQGRHQVYRLRDELVPMVDLRALFGVTAERGAPPPELMVVVEADGQQLGLLVDDLLAQQQVVIKSLEANYGRVPGLSGATILGDGQVAFILDVAGIARLVSQRRPQPALQGMAVEA